MKCKVGSSKISKGDILAHNIVAFSQDPALLKWHHISFIVTPSCYCCRFVSQACVCDELWIECVHFREEGTGGGGGVKMDSRVGGRLDTALN